MKRFIFSTKKQLSTLALGYTLIASTALALVNCTDPAAPTTYTVRFNANGGTPNEEGKTVEAGKHLAQPSPDPTKEGHTFAGWYKDQALTQAFEFDTEKITAGITLYAKWIPITYTVTFNPNNKDRVTSQSVAYGDVVPKPETPTKDYHTFLGWFKDETLTQAFDFDTEKITAGITIYAKWIPITYTVTFNPNNKDRVTSQSVAYGDVVPKPENPTKDYHTFLGWFKDETLTQAFDFDTEKITAGITLYAKWIPITYTVTFNPNNKDRVTSQSVAYGDVVPKPETPTKDYHTFLGWFKDETLTQAFDFDADTITSTITLYAKWISEGTTVTYTVRFNANGGTPNEEEKTVEAGTLLDKPTSEPTKEGHTFAGWYNDQVLTQAFDFDADTITQDTTLYAKWESHLVTIPDANFRAKLKALIPGAFVGEKLDTTRDEVAGLKQLDLRTLGTNSIKDLTGIQYFTALTKLNCSANRLTDLDVSKNIQLTQLDCSSNGLGSLDVSKNTALTTLKCYSNNLTDLDVSTNTALTELNCSNNSLTSLDVSTNTMLTDLTCSNNSLTSLDVSTNTMLTDLFCSNNSLTSLDVSKNTALTRLSCWNNKLTYLDVRGMRSDSSRVRYIWYFKIYPFAGGSKTNAINTLKVHESLKNHGEIKDEKTDRGDEMTIETYSAAFGSVEYTLVCSDYDPTTGSEENRCGDEIRYVVTFNSNGGSLVDSISLYHEGGISKPVNPTKIDSLFVGWYKDEALTQAFDFATEKITTNIILYAKWGATAYTVNFNSNGGTNVDQQTVESRKKASKPVNPTKADSLFVGWYKNEALTQAFNFAFDNITADITLYAKWRKFTLVAIPDANFRAKLKARIPNAFVGEMLDTISDDITELTTLNIPFSGIRDLTGIHYFTALTELRCYNNQLTKLDVSNNTALTGLWCYNNQLTKLDVSNNTALTGLWCYNNRLTNLDVSNNTALTELRCYVNQLGSLDVSNNTALTKLSCYRNQLDSLNVSTNTALTMLICGNNSLAGLDVSKNTTLTYLECASNSLAVLEVSKNTALTTLRCNDNSLAGLEVSKNTALERLDVNNNNLGSLDVSKNTQLTTLRCDDNRLTGLDVSTNTKIEELQCYNNQLTRLDVSNNTALTKLGCSNNNLTVLDVSNNTALTMLWCGGNQLTYLDIRGMRSVTWLDIHDTTGETNVIDTLKVHENIQDHAQISAVKTARGDKVKIETYSAATESTSYTAVCSDYDPTEADEQDRCKDED